MSALGCYGWYSNRMRGDRKRQLELAEKDSQQQFSDTSVIDIKGYRVKRIPPLMLRMYSKGIYSRAYQKGAKSALIWEVDPLTCPKCAGEMRIVSSIYQRQVIRWILEHLKIYEDKPQRVPPQKKIEVREVEMVPFDDGWPGYDEPIFEP